MRHLLCVTSIVILIAMLMSLSVASAATKINSDGYYKGIRLAGRVKVVEHFGDIKVKVVNHFPDLRVKVVSSFPDDVGEWQFVDYGEDFTVQFVDNFPDIKIQYVEHFPGVE